MTMETVRSRDGTTIAYWRSGHGPALLLVHGSISDGTIWTRVGQILEDRFTVHIMNRRGREGSGPPLEHELEREFEDVVAVIDAIGHPVHLVGHSAGAHCALGAALLTQRVRSLVLYEPPPPGPGMAALARVLRERVEAGRPDDAIVSFISQAQTPEQIEQLRRSPMWATLVAFAPSTAVDVAALAGHNFEAARFATLNIPVLLLVGGESSDALRQISEVLARVLPNVQVQELAGQQHMANMVAPDLFASEVAAFLEGL